eukprot:169017-Hanusia_phi.AAC.1
MMTLNHPTRELCFAPNSVLFDYPCNQPYPPPTGSPVRYGTVGSPRQPWHAGSDGSPSSVRTARELPQRPAGGEQEDQLQGDGRSESRDGRGAAERGAAAEGGARGIQRQEEEGEGAKRARAPALNHRRTHRGCSSLLRDWGRRTSGRACFGARCRLRYLTTTVVEDGLTGRTQKGQLKDLKKQVRSMQASGCGAGA